MSITKKQRRKAQFKEIASNLIARSNSKWTRMNLGQSFAAELEKAYQLGRSEAGLNDDAPVSETLAWIDIPRRFRTSFERLVMMIDIYPNAGYILHQDERYYFYHDAVNITPDSTADLKQGWAASSIDGLKRLGLLEQVESDNCYAFCVSKLGREVYRNAIKEGECIGIPPHL